MAFSSTAGLLEVTNESTRTVRAIGTAASTSIPTKGDVETLIGSGGAIEYAVYMNSDSSSVAAGAYVTVPFDTEFAAVSGFAVSAGEITIPTAGRYRIDYQILGEFTTANTKGRCPFVLQSNVSGSFATVDGTVSDIINSGGSSTTFYQRGVCVGYGYVTTTDANQKVKVYGGPVQNAGSAMTLIADGCRLTVSKR